MIKTNNKAVAGEFTALTFESQRMQTSAEAPMDQSNASVPKQNKLRSKRPPKMLQLGHRRCPICGKMIPHDCSNSWVQRHCSQNGVHSSLCDATFSHRCRHCKSGVIVLTSVGARARTERTSKSDGKLRHLSSHDTKLFMKF